MKVCSKCGEDLPEDEFYSDPRKEGRLRSVCKTCWAKRKKTYREKNKEMFAEKNRQYYEANKKKINQRVRKWRKENHHEIMERQRERRQEASALLLKLKTPCVKCGENRRWVIHFHHIDPAVKSFELSADTVAHKKIGDVKNEASKCACLCANCHTEFHHFYGNNPDNPEMAFEEYLGGEKHETFI